MSDGRASLALEYYLGRSEAPVLDDDGNPVLYTSGAMKGKPKYTVKHKRKKEALNLYIWVAPRSAQERQQNKNTLQLTEKIRFEREQELLEDRKGYRLKKEKECNFLRYFEEHRDNENFTKAVRGSYKYSYNRFVEYLAESTCYQKYTSVLPMDAITPDMVLGFTNYLRKKCTGEGPRKHYHWFKKVVADAVEEELIRKNPCKGIKIVYDTNVMTKDILSPQEINKLATCHYKGENRMIQKAFIFCCYTGLRCCDVSELTYSNIDYDAMVMRFTQKKSAGRSAHAAVVTPLNSDLLRLIGTPPDGDYSAKIFTNLERGAIQRHLTKWVKAAGINKHITWHCARHSFAVNLLNAGANIKTVSSLLGHASIKMTEKYLHVVDPLRVDAINSLGPISFSV